MGIANVNGMNNQGDLCTRSKVTDDKKADISPNNQVTDINTLQQAAIISQGEKTSDTGVYGSDAELEEKRAEKKEAEEAEKSEKESLDAASKQMSEQDYAALMNEGISFESFEAGRLDRALTRIKENIIADQEHVEVQVENKEEMRETIKKIAIAIKIPDSFAKDLAQKLLDSDLPVTQENVMSLVSALGMAGAVNNFSDGGKAYLIDNELAPTVENIYHSQYSGIAAGAGVNDFKAIENQVKTILENAKMVVNDESMRQANWLYQNNLPITEESLKSLQTLEDMKENADTDYILNKMTEAMAKGNAPEKANLDDSQHKQIKKALQDLNKLEESLANNTDVAAITAKRQLEEIRLKLTSEAGLRLLSKGIKLDTTKLQDIVEGLKELEKEYYQGILKECKVEGTEENINILKNTLDTADGLKDVPAYVLGSTLKQRHIETAGTLLEAGTSMKAVLDKAEASYEALKTEPRKDMGDSIKKAFKNIPALLNEMGVEDTSANQRAVRILSYNNMEINKESIQEVKSYDFKVNQLMEELTPSTTVELIKRNINPLEVTIDDLTNQVRAIREEIGAGAEEKYSKFLWQLEKNHSISQEERSSYIGIYRLLNNVEKTDGAAIGAVVNSGMELTLKNLLTAVRSKKSAGLDVSVDDSVGGLKSLSFTKESITDQIEAGFNKNESKPETVPTSEQSVYYQEVIDRIMDKITPELILTAAKDTTDGLMDMSVEELLDYCEQESEYNYDDMEYAAHMTEKLRDIAKTSEKAVAFLETHQIETSIKNIAAAGTFFTEGKSFFKEFQKNADKEYNELVESVSDSIEDADSLQEKFLQIEEKVEAILNDKYKESVNSETSDQVESLHLYGNGIALARKLSHQEYYEIPIMTGEQVTTMNLTILKGTKESGKVQISMDTEAIGKVEGEFTLKEQTIKGFILCDTKDGLDTMDAIKNRIKKGLENLDLEVKQLSIGYDKKVAEQVKHQTKESTDETSSQLLYQVAKVIVKTIGTAIQ